MRIEQNTMRRKMIALEVESQWYEARAQITILVGRSIIEILPEQTEQARQSNATEGTSKLKNELTEAAMLLVDSSCRDRSTTAVFATSNIGTSCRKGAIDKSRPSSTLEVTRRKVSLVSVCFRTVRVCTRRRLSSDAKILIVWLRSDEKKRYCRCCKGNWAKKPWKSPSTLYCKPWNFCSTHVLKKVSASAS